MKTNSFSNLRIVGLVVVVAAFTLICSPDLHAGTFTVPALSNGNGEDYTIVEVDPFLVGGAGDGNTVQTADAGAFWTTGNNRNDGLWWNRGDTASLSTTYTGLDAVEASQRIYVLNLENNCINLPPVGESLCLDNDAVQLKTTVSGLAPGGYDVFSVYAGGGLGRSIRSDLEAPGVTSATTLRTSEVADANPVIAFSASFSRDIVLDPLGTTAPGVTSFSVFTGPGDISLGNRTYWIGVAYQQTSIVPEPSTLVLAVCGLIGLCAFGRRKRRRATA